MRQYKYYIITFGCQMNRSDSERLASLLERAGLARAEAPEESDVIIMNSCSVRASAEDRIFGRARNFEELKKKNPNLIVGVMGCMPGRDKDGRMRRKLKCVDLYFPTKDMILLPMRLFELNPNLRPMESVESDYLAINPNYQKKYQAFVAVQTGCGMFCAYCVVPYARGLEMNRSLKSILDEVNSLAAKGCLEITLLGQIVNHYTAPDPQYFSVNNPYKTNDFAKLLWEVNRVGGIKRVHWTGPHPLYMDDEVIDALNLPNQVNFIHLPVQSGSSEVLKRMNRRHDREFYISIIKKIRNKRPDIAVGTDIIVGFCGETEKEFNDTISMYKECDFDISYNAQYSARSGTAAAKMFDDDVPKSKKKERWLVLQNLMESITYKKNQSFVGKRVSVLVDEYKDGWCGGNSNEMKRARFKGSESLIGTIQDVEVFKADTWMLYAYANRNQKTS